MRTVLAMWFLLVACILTGCVGAPEHHGPYMPQSEAARDPLEAQRLTHKAADLVVEDPDEAERLLRKALSCDLHHGPAHNNLGVVYLQRGQLYEAAAEFEWARKLMPGHPDPRINLGIALEQAGRVGEAIDAYRAALESRPEHLGAMQALTLCELRHERANDGTYSRLEQISLRSNPKWRDWARQQLNQRTSGWGRGEARNLDDSYD